ncbi:MAG: glycine cleavage T C-terminal barrel domain-containing protein [Rhizomicrobium sp.]|jgi:aminomethyltransferase
MSDTTRATPCHPRTAAANRLNAWTTRNGVTLPATYGDVNEEIITARSRVVVTDLGARWQVTLEGPRVVEYLQRFVTRDVARLAPGGATRSLWLADGGGVRGAAVIARFGRESFWLVSAARDDVWLSRAAQLYDVKVRDISAERAGLAVIGPYARATVEAMGLQVNLEALSFRRFTWRTSDVVVSRFGEHGGYEIWCTEADATLVWDRILRAGATFGLIPVGTAAMDTLDLEAGIPRPFLDYVPATAGDAREPCPEDYGMLSLIDKELTTFNGQAKRTRDNVAPSWRLMGIEIESQCPAPHTPLSLSGQIVGRTLSSLYSPSLRRAIALAQISPSAATAGARLSLMLPPSLDAPELRMVEARIVDLPFLAQPDSITP